MSGPSYTIVFEDVAWDFFWSLREELGRVNARPIGDFPPGTLVVSNIEAYPIPGPIVEYPVGRGEAEDKASYDLAVAKVQKQPKRWNVPMTFTYAPEIVRDEEAVGRMIYERTLLDRPVPGAIGTDGAFAGHPGWPGDPCR